MRLPGFIIIAASVIASSTLHAQTEENRQRARELGREAIEAVDNGDLDKGFALLKQADSLDPTVPIYRYEQAYIHVVRKEYREALVLTEAILRDSAQSMMVGDVVYQLTGNCHDFLGDANKAVSFYAEGLKRFPNSGPLHLELGVMAFKENNIDEAVDIWEEGVRLAPEFPSNYYWAAKMFCASTEPLWGLLYGELFINLEPGSRRTEEISALLYRTYNRAVTIRKDSISVDLSSNIIRLDTNNLKEFRIPFHILYGLTFSVASAPVFTAKSLARPVVDTLTLADLDAIRQEFTTQWFAKEKNKSTRPPMTLFDFHKRLAEAGHFETYNYWLMSRGAQGEFDAWYAKNEKKFRSFVGWLRENHFRIDRDHVFSRPK